MKKIIIKKAYAVGYDGKIQKLKERIGNVPWVYSIFSSKQDALEHLNLNEQDIYEVSIKSIDNTFGVSYIYTEYICGECNNLFRTEQEPTLRMKCPREWCAGYAERKRDGKWYEKSISEEEKIPTIDINA